MTGLFVASAFDSELFGLRWGRLRATAADVERTPAAALRAEADAYAFADGRLPASARGALRRLLEAGFWTGDVVVALDRPLGPAPQGEPAEPGVFAVRAATAADAEGLRPIAVELARVSRFAREPALGPGAAERLYDRWIANSLAREAAREVLVAENEDGRLAALVTLAPAAERMVELVLVGVAPGFRGRGAADLLVGASVAWAAKTGATGLLVRTALENVPAQRLYQRCGFRTREASWVLHRAREKRT